MKTLFWLVLIGLVVAGVIVGQDQANQGLATSELTGADRAELAFDIGTDEPSLFSDEQSGSAADEAAINTLKDISGETVSIETKEVRYSVVDTDNVPEDILVTIKETKENPTSMVFEGEPGTQYVYIALGRRMTGGYLISIESVEQVGERVVVRYNEIRPSKDDIVTLANTFPWIVLKVQSDLPIDIVATDSTAPTSK